MTHEVIEKYLNEILKPHLIALGVSDIFIEKVTATIRNQVYSCMYNWNDDEFRKGLLVIGSEEGLFYKPYANDDIRNFVVLTIRNSEIEWLQTGNFALTGLKSKQDDSYIKPITSAAIEYFKNVDFNLLSEQLEEPPHDVYGELYEKYPMAFRALIILGNYNEPFLQYKKVEDTVPVSLNTLPAESKANISLSVGDRSNLSHVEADGLSFAIDKDLRKNLEHSVKNKIPFICDSFKSVSRNAEKLLLIMEYVLSHNSQFVTSNYFLMSDYIERRKKLVRAGHDRNGMIRNWKNLNGLCENHKYALRWASEGLK
jgi:hypothetical protein